MGSSAIPFPLFPGFGHLLVGDVVALLTDGCMFVEIHRAQRIEGPPLAKLLSPVFDSSGTKDKLIVHRSQVRVIGVYEDLQMVLVLILELVDGHLLLLYLPHILCHRFCQVRISQFVHIFKPGYLSFLPDVGEEFSPFYHLFNKLGKRYRLPLIRASRA